MAWGLRDSGKGVTSPGSGAAWGEARPGLFQRNGGQPLPLQLGSEPSKCPSIPGQDLGQQEPSSTGAEQLQKQPSTDTWQLKDAGAWQFLSRGGVTGRRNSHNWGFRSGEISKEGR